jgi:protein TonB
MFELQQENLGRARRIGWSVGIHAAILIVLLHSRATVRVRAYQPGTPSGSRVELSYLPGKASMPTPVPQPKRKTAPVAKDPSLSLASMLPLKQAFASAVSAQTTGESSSGANDAFGTDDIRIALTTFSPSPKPDLSRLPHGTQGEVVLDVTIDPAGQVADLQILQTLGYGIDTMVAETVRTWRFSPATRDGVPVASVQELHFHYGPV